MVIRLTFKDTPISNNDHFKEKTLPEKRYWGKEEKQREKRQIVQEGGEATFIGAHPPGPLPAKHPAGSSHFGGRLCPRMRTLLFPTPRCPPLLLREGSTLTPCSSFQPSCPHWCHLPISHLGTCLILGLHPLWGWCPGLHLGKLLCDPAESSGNNPLPAFFLSFLPQSHVFNQGCTPGGSPDASPL